MNNKQNFIKGAVILTSANLVSRVIGAIFKIPLANLIGQYGMGLFVLAHTLFVFILDVSVSGFPVAISKMIAESRARKDELRCKKILHISLLLLGIIGFIGAAASWIFAVPFAKKLGNSNAYIGVVCAAPAIFFVSVTSVFRGYFQGYQNMYPTAISELVESSLKLVMGYGLAFILLKTSIEYAAAGAVSGITIGTVLSFLFMLITYLLSNRKNKKLYAQSSHKIYSTKSILKELLHIALPITLGAILTNITTLIDLVTITSGLQKIPGVTSVMASSLYGSYAGCIVAIFNFPLIIVLAVRMSIVPAIAGSLAIDDYLKARNLISRAQKLLNIFSIPFAILLIVLSQPILQCLFKDQNLPVLLQILSISILPNALLFLCSSVLQAYGEVNKPVIYMLIGGIVKVTLNYLLIPKIGIISAPISTGAYTLTALFFSFRRLLKTTKFKVEIADYVKPLISAGIMGLIAFAICNFSTNYLSSIMSVNIRIILFIALGIATIVSVVIYLVMLFITKAIAKDDILMLPYGSKIADLLCKLRLLPRN